MQTLSLDFFKHDSVVVAKELVGKLLKVDNVLSRITETEAYRQDGSSHARTRTNRSALMFDTYAHIYVYLIYGMYHCLNITTEKDKPGAVLIRGIEPVSGIKCDGPGKLCRCLDITKKDNGRLLGGRISVLDDGFKLNIKVTERIGIKNDTHLPWRFVMDE